MTNWTFICLSPCLLILIGLALFASYAFLDHIYGSQGARMIWPHEIVSFGLGTLAAIVASLALDLIRAETLEALILVITIAVCLIAAVNTFRVRKHIQSVESVLYRSPRREKYAISMLLLIGVSGLIGLALIFLYPTASIAYKTFVILLVILAWILGVNTYMRIKNPLMLTQTSLVVGGSVYHWDRIRLYHFAPPRRYTPLILRARGWFPLTNAIVVPLALEEVDEVSALLAKRLPGLRYTQRATSDVSGASENLLEKSHV
jgi:hypothetical protein